MKKVFSILFIGLVSIACREEITPLKPPIDPPLVSSCKAPSLEKNILGTWRFKAVSFFGNPVNSERSGTITFKADKSVVDPDSLFENRTDIGLVVSKQFSVETTTNSDYAQYGEMLWVRQYGTSQRWLQSYFFKAISNECNRIEFKHPSGNVPLRLILTRD